VTQLDLNIALQHGAFDLAVETAFDLDPITAVFGPSGSGKTSLLRTLAGLERHAKGRIALGNTVWQDDGNATFVPPCRRNIGYVFQDGRLFTHLDVTGNLRFGKRRPASRLCFDDVVTAMDLASLLSRRPASLSGGEQQRVALGRALLTDPVLMLLDEPLSALDAHRKSSIIPYIERIAHEFGVPILYVTHSIDEVSRLATRMLLLADGRMTAFGRVSELLERLDLWSTPGSTGPGTVLTAAVTASDAGMMSLQLDDQCLRLPAIDAPPGTVIRLRIEARDVAIATRRPDNLSIRNVLEATIVRIDEAPPVLAEVLLDVGGQHLRAEVTREAARELGLEPGKSVFALVKSVAIDRSLFA
jgi:molybdate transport system ATP-binding protein